MHRIIRQVLNNPDPYSGIKKQFNQLMLDYYPDLKKRVESAQDPFQLALRFAIAGNVIDFGPDRPFDIDKTLELSRSIILAIDDSQALKDSRKNQSNLNTFQIKKPAHLLKSQISH